jgi:hypothetical protein
MKRSDKPSGMTTTGKTREAVIVFFDAIIARARIERNAAEKSLD